MTSLNIDRRDLFDGQLISLRTKVAQGQQPRSGFDNVRQIASPAFYRAYARGHAL